MVMGYIQVLLVMLVFDGVWLYTMRGFYQENLSHLMAKTPNWWAAIIFYLIYAFALEYLFLSQVDRKNAIEMLVRVGVFGLVAYATYDLTNMATLKNWPTQLVIVDMIWGTVMTVLVGFVVLKLRGLI